MKILISGGRGYLAGRLIESLVGGPNDIYSTYRGDITNDTSVSWIHESEMLKRLPKNIDTVIHLAQSSRYRDFPESASDIFNSNVTMTHQLLEYARTAGAKTFVYTSTGGVYEPSEDKLEEHSAVSPHDFYAASKYASEVLLKPYSSYFSTAVLRLFFLYGPGQKNRLIPSLVERVVNGEPIELTHGEDGLILTPTYVNDVANAVRKAAEEGWQGTLNVASPEELSMRQIGTTIADALGKKAEFKMLRKEFGGNFIPDLGCLSKYYGLDSFRSFEKGLENMLDPALADNP